VGAPLVGASLPRQDVAVNGWMLRLRRWLTGPPLPTIDPAFLERLYERRFPGRDRERLARIWSEVACVSNTDPTQLHEDQTLNELGVGKVRFPDLVLEELCDHASDNLQKIPARQITTLGEYVDWFLDDPQLLSRPPGVVRPRSFRRP